jgi:hypothetical protein
MWRGHEWLLLQYQEAICNEWVRRGYRDTCLEKTVRLYLNHREEGKDEPYPPWIGLYEFHISHQSNLMRKDFYHYRQFFPADLPIDIPYYWPV